MTGAPPANFELQYCPVCHQLIRPSLFQSREAVMQNGVGYHLACLQKSGTAASGNNGGGEEKVAVSSITSNIRPPSARREPSGGHPVQNRKPSGSSPAHPRTPHSARHSGPQIRAHPPARSGVPTSAIFAIGFLVLAAGAAIIYLVSSSQSPTDTAGAAPLPSRPAESAAPRPSQPTLNACNRHLAQTPRSHESARQTRHAA